MVQVRPNSGSQLFVFHPSEHEIASAAKQSADSPGRMVVVDRQATPFFVALMPTRSAFLSKANRAFAVLRGQDGLVIIGGYAEQAFHGAPSVSLANAKVTPIETVVSLALLFVDAIKMTVAPFFSAGL